VTAGDVGRYRIVRQIGQGGMATVYLARQPGLEREVALKQLNRFGIADERVFTSRFDREALLAGSLNHPNIVTVYDYFEVDGRPYIAMEYVEGGSLRDYLRDLSTAQVVGVLEGMLAGLTHAESRGIAHRDIKPENILVTAEGRVKLTDFGIAKAYNAAFSGSLLTVAGTTVGTPTYMAPEQATGRGLGPGTDLYAVGGRSAGSFASSRSSHRHRRGSRSGRPSRGSGSGSLTCCQTIASGFSLESKGTRPTSISYATTPTA